MNKLFDILKEKINKTSLFNDVFIVKGFTLIELLGVLAILGIIGLITYPVVNKSINNSRQKALEETIRYIEHAADLYSMDNPLETSPAYNNLDINLLKEAGFLEDRDIINPVTEEEMDGCLIYRWIKEQYEFKYIYPCQETPTIAVSNKDGVFNEKGWSTSGFYVDIKGNGTSYSYCISDKECIPNTEVENSSGNVYINTNGSYYVCAYAINELGVSETKCEQFNLDTNAPVITNIAYFDKGDNKLSDLLDVTSVSGYKASCNKKYVKDLIIGNNIVNCTITSNNGLSTTQNITFKPNMLKVAGSGDTTFLGSKTLKEKVESITALDYIDIPSNKIEAVDVSETQNKSIMAWYVDEDNNGKYEMYIGQNGGILANINSENLFRNFNNVLFMNINAFDASVTASMNSMFWGMSNLIELDLSSFDTSNVTNMGWMFRDMNKLIKLNIDSFDTSKVTNMAGMFYKLNSLKILEISHFDTEKVKDMSYMFLGMGNLTQLDTSNLKTSEVTNMAYMFYGVSGITELDISDFNTSKVTDMSYMFGNCSSLTLLDVSSFNTSKVTNMEFMFFSMSNLKNLNVKSFDTSNVTNMRYMFSGVQSLTNLELSSFNTSKVTNMGYMFNASDKIISLDLSNFNTSNVTDMSFMFNCMFNLNNLNVSGFDTSKVTNMSNMFTELNQISTLDIKNFDTSLVTDMSRMFYGCENLNELNISNFNVDKVNSYANIFGGVDKNPTITINNNIKTFIESILAEAGVTATFVIAS